MQIQISGAPRTMTSRELAELAEKRHDNVMRVIESLEDAGLILPQLEEVPNDGAGPKTIRQYRLNQRDSYVVMARLSPEFTARLVDRWQELEAGAPKPAIPQTYAAALRLAAEQAEQIEQQAAALALAAPKVEMVDRYMDATGTQTFRQVAKLLGAKEPAFRAFLAARRILYQIGGTWTPYAEHLDAGRFVVKTGSADNGHAFSTARFTPKGVAWVSALWRESAGGAA